jgi:hypothetical protein
MNPLRTPMVERHYAYEEHCQILPGVLQSITPVQYQRIQQVLEIRARSDERALGTTLDTTRHYVFSGQQAFLQNGLVQVGTAMAGGEEKFEMVRLFANSLEQMSHLEAECLLHQ